jgi:hypothetical protein
VKRRNYWRGTDGTGGVSGSVETMARGSGPSCAEPQRQRDGELTRGSPLAASAVVICHLGGALVSRRRGHRCPTCRCGAACGARFRWWSVLGAAHPR